METIPNRLRTIDVDIQIGFKSEYLELVLPHIKDLGISENVIDEMIDGYIASGELVSYDRWILEWGERVLNGILNTKLKRHPDHPTFNNLLRYALKDRLEQDITLVQLKKFKGVV